MPTPASTHRPRRSHPLRRPPRLPLGACFRHARAIITLAVISASAVSAQAHDSWFSEAQPPRPMPGRTVLALSTGAHFPVQETAIAPEYLREQGCRGLSLAASPAPAAQPLVPLGLVDTALLLAVPSALASPTVAPQPVSCWLQTSAFELDLKPELVPVYLDEVRPGPEILAAWRSLQARGLPWLERYTKHVRIELPGGAAGIDLPEGERQAPQPAPLGLDLVLDADSRGLRTDRPVSVRLLRDGQPLAGHAVELRNERLALGIWLKTDAQGRTSSRLPLPGRWLVRAIDLRVSAERPDTFDSRFITLALTVGAAPRR